MLARIRNSFITGIAVIFPVLLTILIVRFLVMQINNFILNPLINTIRAYLGGPYHVYLAKAIVFILVIVAILAVGWATNFIVLRRFFGFGEKIFLRVPMIGKIYLATKQISSAFIGQGKTIFKKVVLIEYPRKGLYSIGFVTAEEKGEISAQTGEEMISIFVPTTPNPTSGMFILQSRKDVVYLKMSVEEGMKMIVSGGAISAFNKPAE